MTAIIRSSPGHTFLPNGHKTTPERAVFEPRVGTPSSATGSHRALWRLQPGNGDHPMKKLLLLAILGGIGYLVYRQYMASQAEQDLWAEATAAPDLR